MPEQQNRQRRASLQAAAIAALPLLSQQAPLLAVPVALLLALALVVQLLALGERELDLGAALVVEIELQRHQGHAVALDRADQLVDLALVQQQFARTLRRVIEAPGLQIFGDVGIDQPDLAAPRVGIGFGDRGLAGAQRLHLAAGERDAGLELLADLVVETRLAVLGDDLEAWFRLRRHQLTISRNRSPRISAAARRRRSAAPAATCRRP